MIRQVLSLIDYDQLIKSQTFPPLEALKYRNILYTTKNNEVEILFKTLLSAIKIAKTFSFFPEIGKFDPIILPSENTESYILYRLRKLKDNLIRTNNGLEKYK